MQVFMKVCMSACVFHNIASWWVPDKQPLRDFHAAGCLPQHDNVRTWIYSYISRDVMTSDSSLFPLANTITPLVVCASHMYVSTVTLGISSWKSKNTWKTRTAAQRHTTCDRVTLETNSPDFLNIHTHPGRCKFEIVSETCNTMLLSEYFRFSNEYGLLDPRPVEKKACCYAIYKANEVHHACDITIMMWSHKYVKDF